MPDLHKAPALFAGVAEHMDAGDYLAQHPERTGEESESGAAGRAQIDGSMSSNLSSIAFRSHTR
jgi:hypothetical protein